MWIKKIIASIAVFAVAGGVFAGDAGVTDTEIKLGASAVLSGPLGAQTAEYGVGSRLYFDWINQQGGIHGRKITYTTLDDKFDPKLAVENTRKLLEEEKVFLIYNNTGTGHTAAILPLAVEAKTVVFSPVTGASLFREQFNRYVFHVRASYADEARHIHAQLSRMGMQRVALFYQDDAFGKTLQAEVQKAAAAQQMPLAAEVVLDVKQPDFAAAAQALAQARPQVVIMGTGGSTFTNLVKAMRATDARPSFYGFSVAGLEVIKKDLGAASRGIVLAQVFPSVSHVSLPVVSDYHRLLKAKDPEAKPSAAQLEGFVQAWVLVEGLKRTGRTLNTETFIQAMEKIGDLSFGKFLMRYTPQTHNGSGVAELAIIDHQGHLRH